MRRGEILLDLGLLHTWGEEPEGMSRDKEGARYRYPYGLIRLQGILRALFRLPHRRLEGFTHALSRWEPMLRAPDYSTTCRRADGLIGLERARAVDVRTRRIVAMEVTDERTGDGGLLEPLVMQARRRCNVAWILADGAFDSRENFTYLGERDIEPGIKVRKSSSPRAKGCPARKTTVFEYLENRRPRRGRWPGCWWRRP